MASYNELNALIDAYINRNGVQAITGQILNGVLKAMVEQLGRGYTIMGAAIPTTDPGTPDGPECYFASTPGTYTDFDGLQVAPGELALLCYTPSDGWTKETIYEGFQEVGATIDENVGTPSVGVSYANGVLSFDFRNMKGNTGDAAGFGTIGADITGGVGTPGVTVESSGPATAKNLQFHFTNLKGETGVTSVVASVDNTTGNPSCSVSLVGQELHLDFTGLKGAQGDTGSSVDYPFTIVNNLTTDDATQALSAAQGVVLEGEITQLEAKVDGLDVQINGGSSTQPVTKAVTIAKRIASSSGAWTTATDINTDSFAVTAGKTYHLVVPALSNNYTAVYGFGDEVYVDQNVGHITLPDPVVKGSVSNYEADIVIPAGFVALYVCYTVASGSPTLTTTQQADGLVDRIDAIEDDIDALNTAVADIPGIKEDIDDIEADVADINNKIGGEIETGVAWDTYSGGTLQLSGQIVYSTSTNNVLMVLPVERGKYKSIKATLAHSVDNYGTYAQILMFTDNYSDYTNKVKGVAYSSPTTEGVYDYDETIPDNVDYIVIFNRAGVLATPTIKVVELTPNSIESRLEKLENDTTPEHRYMTCVKKPNVLSGKMLYFFGDSITRGYIIGGTISTHNYPKEFSEAIGANYVNYAESGTSLSGTGGIAEKIESTSLASCDLAFVAGGINDWQTGKSEQEIKDAVTDICDYFTNAGKECIFITPINHAGRIPNNTPLVSVEQVREIITRIALSYGFGVVQGWEFPFPDETDDADYISEMFQDKLHPTDAGYIMYAIALRNAVL